MGYIAEIRMSSGEQETSKGLMEKAVSLRASRIRKSVDYCKVEDPLYVSQHHVLRQSVADDPVVHLHSLMNHNKLWLQSMGNKDGGLVKHVRNLPGYLQRVEKSDNIQGKALNCGVLDWGHLENWKSNEKCITPRYNMKASFSSNNPTLLESGSARFSRSMNKNLPPQRDQQASNASQINLSCGEKLPPGVRWPGGKAVKVQNAESAPRRIMLDRGQTPCLKDLSSDSNYHKVNLDSSKGKQAEQVISSQRETSSSEWRRHGSQQSPHEAEENIDHASDPSPGGRHNVVLFSPGDSPESSSHDLRLSESRKSHDGNLTEVNERRLSNCFSPDEFHSMNPFSDEHLTTDEASKNFDLDISEPFVKGRHSSPNRRFSFSLGKMTRSFSFKESSSVPQLSPTYTSAKSGPINFEASRDLDDYNRKQGNATNKARSSPFRRLLSPLLKHKGAHLPKKVQQSEGNLNSTSFGPVCEKSLLQVKKHKSSNVQALLQLTMKNEIPFFKLVVDSSSDILAAAVKKLPSSGKDDSSLTYAFYSVHEIKTKSGGWINQGSEGKKCSFGYNIVGQMKISSSYHAEFSGPEKDLFVVRESVLYSTDLGRADHITPDCMLNRELAAIIVKNPSDERCGDIGSSESTVVILPGGVHSLPNRGRPSPLINRWRSGGTCDCEGWDIGCQLRVLTNHNEMVKTSSPSIRCATSNHLDLCYQGGQRNKPAFSLAPLQDGHYSLEYNATSISMLQAFSICVAVVSSQKLTHIFQVNYLPESKDIRKSKFKSQTTVCSEIPARYASKPPVSPVGRV